jgi:glutathione S-transferase
MSQYTLPAIEHDSTVIMDSLACAQYLDAHFPETPLLFPNPDSVAFSRLVQYYLMASIAMPIFPFLLPRVVALLDDRGAEYFKRTREEDFGFEISEAIHDDKEKLEEAWDKARSGLKRVNGMLLDNKEGPYFGGRQRSYPDLILLAVLKW